MEWIDGLILIGMLLMGLLVGVLVKYDDKLSWLKKNKNPPLKCLDAVTNQEHLTEVLEFLPGLSMTERELIIMRCFGRPVTVVKSIDSSGQMWFEQVVPSQEQADVEGIERFLPKADYTG